MEGGDLGLVSRFATVTRTIDVVKKNPLVAACVGLSGGVDAAAGLEAGGGTQVKDHVVLRHASPIPIQVGVFRPCGRGGVFPDVKP